MTFRVLQGLAFIGVAVVVATVGAITARPAAQTASSGPPGRRTDLPIGSPGMVSPNGRHFAIASSEGLRVQDLSSGARRDVTTASAGETIAPDVLWSSDSERILFRAVSRSNTRATELRTVRPDGTDLRVVATGREYGAIVDWSKDGLQVLVRTAGASGISVLSLADGTMRVLLKGGAIAERGRFSPDGRYVVHGVSDPKTELTDINVIKIDGTDDRALLASPDDEEILGWSPDGGSLLFTKDLGIWMATVADGRVQAPPRLLKQDVGTISRLVGITRGGGVYYRVVGPTFVFHAPLDPATGKLAAAPARINVRGDTVSQWAPAWSPDGGELAYKQDSAADDVFIAVAAADGSRQRDLAPGMPGGLPFTGGFSWARDGRSLLVDGGDAPNGRHALGAYAVDARDGETTMVVSKPLNTVAVNQIQWLRDAKSVVYLETWRSIVVKNLDTGDERRLYEAGSAGELDSLALSPDGRSLAFRDLGQELIQVMPISGGTPRTVARVPGFSPASGHEGDSAMVAWSHDGRFVIFSDGHDLLRVPAGGGPSEKIGLTAVRAMGDIAVEPNGRSIVVVMWPGEGTGVRVIEHLLPAVKVAP